MSNGGRGSRSLFHLLDQVRLSSQQQPFPTFCLLVRPPLPSRSIKLDQMPIGLIEIIRLQQPSSPPQMSLSSLLTFTSLMSILVVPRRSISSSSGFMAILAHSTRLRSGGSSLTAGARRERMWKHG